jgi:glyoxylase-like metal-dependent hydrolase (beta-lactamase superfamily II)
VEIVKGVHQLQVPIPDNPLGHLNCYLVEGKEGWLMVDTGWNTDEAFNTLQKGVKDLGLNMADIATIVITHIHPDHFGLAGKIKHVSPKTKILMHQWESNMIESRYIKMADLMEGMTTMLQRHGVPPFNLSSLESASMPALRFVTVTFPDRVLYGGEVISTGIFDLEVIWTPGHSPGHVCLYEPDNRLLFAGDHILPGISPNVGYNAQSGDNPLGGYIGALHKLENLPVAKVLPAHEHIFTDMRGRIREILDHHDKRSAEIREAIADEPYTAWEISSRVTWDNNRTGWEQLPPLQKRLAVMETVAHLEYMKWEGKVQRITKEGQVSYIAK